MVVRKAPAQGEGPAGPQGSTGPVGVGPQGPVGPQDNQGSTGGQQSTVSIKQSKTKKQPPIKKVADKKTPPPAKPTRMTTKEVDAAIRKNYPQYAYMLDNVQLFGQDVLNIMRRATRDGWPADRFAGAIERTKYWQNTVQAARNFDGMAEADRQALITKTREELGQYTDVSTIDEAALTTFARDMARRGITGESLRPLAYKFAFDQGETSKAAQDALYSQNAQQIRATANAYGQKIADDQVQTLLENGETPETMQRKYVAKLKAQYPQLSTQLDAGLSFQDIVSDYKQVAASTLEKSADTIDFMDPKYMDAIATPDGKGGYRQLSLGEWQQKLRTDDRFGYATTKQAVQDARVLASSIARSFGRVI